MLKSGQKLEKNEDVVTYSRFSLLQGCPPKIRMKTFYCHHKICNHLHTILRLSDSWANFPLTASERKRGY